MYIPSLSKHNLSMPQRLFSSQIEDTMQPASNQTGDDNVCVCGGALEDPGLQLLRAVQVQARAPTIVQRVAPRRALMQSKQVATMRARAAMTSPGDEGWKCYFAWIKFWLILASFNPKKEVYTQSRNQGIFPQFWQTLSNGGPLRLELVAVGAGPYFNFVSFMS